MKAAADADRRRQENAELLQRMKDPEDSLARYPASSTWFQPRPLVKKDAEAIRRLYGEGS